MIRLGVVGLTVALSLVVTGCSATPAVQQVPALEQRLAEVDAAAAAEDPATLEAAVEALLATVEDAEAAEQLDAGHADRIREAAETLLAAMPEPRQPEPNPTDDPGEDDREPDEEEREPDEEDNDESGSGDRGRGKSHGEDKGKGKGKD